MTDRQALFAALADPTRRAIFEHLNSAGPTSATRLAEDMPITRQAITKHLSALDQAGLVERQQVGREVRYSAVSSALNDIAAWLGTVGVEWDARLSRLRSSFDDRS